MNLRNIGDAKDWFEILQTSGQYQTALMTLRPGGASGAELNAHEKSEQVLLVLEGEVDAEIGREKRILRKGDTVIIRPSVKHRFQNTATDKAVTFNVYAPPEYPA